MQPESQHPVVHIAAAVIRDAHGRFLLVRKRGTNTFMQAGGKIEAGEQPVAALVRELEEELGLVVQPGDLRYLGQFEAEAANEPGHFVCAELFEAPLANAVSAAAEIAELIWLAPTDADLPPLAPLTTRHVFGMG
jgi:8-oxo-dGTP pyrophosphatase MutT (NUDIX family)